MDILVDDSSYWNFIPIVLFPLFSQTKIYKVLFYHTKTEKKNTALGEIHGYAPWKSDEARL